MADLKTLNELLWSASRILDAAAGEIHEIPLNPTYEVFIHENPPEFFSKMAKDRIAKIKTDYDV